MWQRDKLTENFFKYYNKYFPNIIKFVVGSEGDRSRILAEGNRWNYIEAKNKPLSLKWQKGLSVIKKLNPDYVFIIGSDDFISLNYIDKIINRCGNGACGVGDNYYYDERNNKYGYFTHKQSFSKNPSKHRKMKTVGSGRCYSKQSLNKINWILWTKSVNKGLDKTGDIRCKPVAYSMNELKVWLLGVKSRRGTNIWKFDDFNMSKMKIDKSLFSPIIKELNGTKNKKI